MSLTIDFDPLAPLEIVARDDDFVVIDKPAGLHVHQPEPPRRRVPPERTCLFRLRRQIGAYLYPIHRIDAATSGLLVFALKKEVAAMMGRLFVASLVEKEYLAIVRGYLPADGRIDDDLALDSTGAPAPASTSFRRLAQAELPHAVGRRHASARYSLARAFPHTGRFHQIRRHMARLAHPVIGDSAHGDSHHNRFFRESLGLGGLWLRADRFSFVDPRDGASRVFQAPIAPGWRRAVEALGWPDELLLRSPGWKPETEAGAPSPLVSGTTSSSRIP